MKKEDKEGYIDHEVRIQILEHMAKQLNSKMNALLTIAITSVLIPVITKYLWA